LLLLELGNEDDGGGITGGGDDARRLGLRGGSGGTFGLDPAPADDRKGLKLEPGSWEEGMGITGGEETLSLLSTTATISDRSDWVNLC
jgi:hypothetical protein